MLADHGHRIIAYERRPAGDHLIEQSAERIEIGAGCYLATDRLLGSHVCCRAYEHAFLRDP